MGPPNGVSVGSRWPAKFRGVLTGVPKLRRRLRGARCRKTGSGRRGELGEKHSLAVRALRAMAGTPSWLVQLFSRPRSKLSPRADVRASSQMNRGRHRRRPITEEEADRRARWASSGSEPRRGARLGRIGRSSRSAHCAGEPRLQVLERLQAVGNVSFVDRPVEREDFAGHRAGGPCAPCARQYESRRDRAEGNRPAIWGTSCVTRRRAIRDIPHLTAAEHHHPGPSKTPRDDHRETAHSNPTARSSPLMCRG